MVQKNDTIVFLDFDGVLHPEPPYRAELFRSLPLFEAVVTEFERIEVVISSAWRTRYMHSQLCQHFSPGFRHRVIGCTPSSYDDEEVPDALYTYRRHWECLLWMRLNRPPATHWVAVEDSPWHFRPLTPNVLLTDAAVGFTESDATRLRVMLRDR